MHRRPLIFGLFAAWAGLRTQAARATEGAVDLAADFGAHPQARTEWWYVTGSLQAQARRWGFQVTFFRSATGVRALGTSRFEPTELIFAHAAVTDLEHGRLRHDQRIARSGLGISGARRLQTDVNLRDWSLARHANAEGMSRYRAHVASDSAGFGLDLTIDATQPPLLQGNAGLSRKGPDPTDVSHYYSEPQLAVQGRLTLEGRELGVTGRAWLDHEWSDAFVPHGAVGWDWVGMNLDDGAALTAFRLRRPDGSTLYAGGSYRRAGGPVQAFESGAVVLTPLRRWHSAASQATYPVQWHLDTPAGRWQLTALLDDQELDSRGSTGAIYWEGLCDLLDPAGRRVGAGYLEMTGYANALRL
ncbi:MAG: carotenoid 1,2-hydratase [Pseudomonadota bacterium]|nr:carotenoid 1,2-hydratase [Pseudomonadota bacterium]